MKTSVWPDVQFNRRSLPSPATALDFPLPQPPRHLHRQFVCRIQPGDRTPACDSAEFALTRLVILASKETLHNEPIMVGLVRKVGKSLTLISYSSNALSLWLPAESSPLISWFNSYLILETMPERLLSYYIVQNVLPSEPF
jgi:hypothetical protein